MISNADYQVVSFYDNDNNNNNNINNINNNNNNNNCFLTIEETSNQTESQQITLNEMLALVRGENLSTGG